MAAADRGAVKTFSIGFDVGRASTRRAYAREVAQRYGTDHHELVLDETALELVPRLVWHYGEPFADSSALATFALSELASRHVTVALNGDGGDESLLRLHAPRPPLPDRPARAPLRRAPRRTNTSTRGSGPSSTRPSSPTASVDHDWRAPGRGVRTSRRDSADPLERMVDVDVADLPARRPAREDGHRDDGALARGALAVLRPPS